MRRLKLFYLISRHWLAVFVVVYGAFVGLPFLAPAFMHFGWEAPARGLYFFYSFLCHQLPDRSLFLFGPKGMVTLPEIQAAGQEITNPLLLRQFIGNAMMGWKVAWSDRMVSMYGGILVAALMWGAFRRLSRPLPLWWMVLLALPIAIDGGTHFLSDLSGLDQGFRYTNAWLAALTGSGLPADFYLGNALGSFNSWMRWITGILFAFGIVWYGFPYLDETARDLQRLIGRMMETHRAVPRNRNRAPEGNVL